MTKPTLPALAALQAFEAAARLGSFTKAASERNLTHSAISRSIQSIEHWCGEKLFERNGPKVVLSEAGFRLKLRLIEPLQALHAALDLEIEPAEKLKLKLVMLSSIASTWLVPLLPEFAKACPRIELSIETGYDMVSLPPLQPIVGIRYGHFSRTGLRCHRLWFDRMVAVAAPTWVSKYGTVADLWPASQLLRHSYEPWPQRLTSDIDGPAGKPGPAEGYEFNDALLLVNAAVVGCGVAWVRASLVDQLVGQGSLQIVGQSEQISDKAMWMVCREDTADVPAVREFCKWALENTRSERGP
jgi:LysR family glycine cleavage system transcriptional activator